MLLTPFDLKRLESYANNMLDYHVILDLMPTVANLYFQKRLGSSKVSEDGEGQVRLTAVQSSILLALGVQRKTLEDLEVSHHWLFSVDKRILTFSIAEGAPAAGLAEPRPVRKNHPQDQQTSDKYPKSCH